MVVRMMRKVEGRRGKDWHLEDLAVMCPISVQTVCCDNICNYAISYDCLLELGYSHYCLVVPCSPLNRYHHEGPDGALRESPACRINSDFFVLSASVDEGPELDEDFHSVDETVFPLERFETRRPPAG